MRTLLLLLLFASPCFATTWYVRSDGATSPTCSGQSDAASSAAPNCAFNSPQEAINAAALGDTINVRAGDTFIGNFILPLKAGSSYLTIQSSRVGELPAGVRVSSSQAALFAKLQSNNVDAVVATPDLTASHHYKFIGIEFSLNADTGFSVIRLGDSAQTSLAQVPDNLVFDRCYIHGQPTFNSQRGVTLNSSNTTISNSYISEIHWVGVEAQALGGWNGPGPFTITNNYVEAAGINILFGGAHPAISNLVASDIVITNNYLFKPLSWRVGDPSYGGIHWTEKNLLELKNARRVTVTNNLMENSWPDAQVGWAIIFNTIDEDVPWNAVEDVDFSHNTIRHSSNGMDIRGAFASCLATRIKRVNISFNTFEDVGAFSGEGKDLLLLNSTEDITINHNTLDGTSSFLLLSTCGTLKHTNLVVKNNLASAGTYAVFGDGGYFGTAALNQYAASYTFTKNALYGLAGTGLVPAQFPADNYFPTTLAGAAGLLGTDGLQVGASSTQVCSWNTTPVCQ